MKSKDIAKGLINTVYRRPISRLMTPLTSKRGKEIFKNAIQKGDMEVYFPISEQHVTQYKPSTCGSSSMIMTLNALGIDPGRVWKG